MTETTRKLITSPDPKPADLAGALLAALKEIESHHTEKNRAAGRPEWHSKTLRIARAAIAKAEGK
jgi:hypothetical protein